MITRFGDVEFFMQRVLVDAESHCWIWQQHRNRLGYGAMQVQGQDVQAHRYVFMSLVGPIPAGMKVLHKCDNRACINPEHLWIGTQGDNMRDMHAKGRGPKGFIQPMRRAMYDAIRAEKRAKGLYVRTPKRLKAESAGCQGAQK